MLGEEHFRLMKPHSLFINNGRGSTVDEAALIRALEEGWIDAAGLDVLEQEPPDPENPLLHMENVTITPHVASASARFDPRKRRRVAEEIALVLTGRWPMACVNPTVLGKTDLRRCSPTRWNGAPPDSGRSPGPQVRRATSVRVSGLIAAHTQNTLLRITDLVTGRYMAVRMEPVETRLTVGEMLDRYVKRPDTEALVSQQRMTADSGEALHAVQDYVYRCSDDGRLGDLYPGCCSGRAAASWSPATSHPASA